MTREIILAVFLLFACANLTLPGEAAGQPITTKQQELHKHYQLLNDKIKRATDRGEYANALQLIQETIAFSEQKLYPKEPHHFEIAQLYQTCGLVQNMLLDSKHASQSFLKACSLLRKNLEVNGINVDIATYYVSSLVSQARHFRSVGDYDAAIESCEEAKRVLREAKLEQSLIHSELLQEFGQTRGIQHNRGEALDCLTRAVQICIATNAPPVKTQIAMLCLANFLIESNWIDSLDVLDKAEKLLIEVEKGKRNTWNSVKYAGNEDSFAKSQLAAVLEVKARLYLQRDSFADAEATCQEAEKLLRDIDARKLPFVIVTEANCLSTRAMALHLLNRSPAAEKTLEMAIMKKSVLGVELKWEATKRRDLGLMYLSRKEMNLAWRELQKSMDCYETLLTTMLPYLSDRQRLVFLAEQRGVLDAWLTVAQASNLPDDEIWSRVISWKGRSVIRHPAATLALTSPELRPLVRDYQHACQSLTCLHENARPDNKLWIQKKQETEREVRRLDGELAQRSGFPMTTPAITPNDIENALPEGVTVIDYVYYAHFVNDTARPGLYAFEPRLLAFVARKNSKLVRIALPCTGKELAGCISNWHKLLNHQETSVYPPELNNEANRLAAKIWRPLQQHLGDPQLVIVCPDGPLVHFPFAALPGKLTRSYLIDDMDISYALSARQVFQMFPFKKLPTGKPNRNALISAGVDYGKPVRPNSLPDLSETMLFGEKIKVLFEERHPDESATLLSGRAASRIQFVAETKKDYRLISSMLHGSHPPAQRSQNSGMLRFQGIQRQSLEDLLDIKLFFAGANDNPDNDASAVLTGAEFAALRLKTDLLEFFCCGSAEGSETRGEGAISFVRMGHLAGAPTVLASLFRENADHALLLADRFHRYLWQHSQPSIAMALCQAQRDHRALGGANSHPRYWAGWVLSGNVGSITTPTTTQPPILLRPEGTPFIWWVTCAGGCLVFPAISYGLWRYCRRSV